MQRAVVLLVEDNPDDVIMIREAFEQSLTPVQLYVVSNGEQAIKFVRRTDAAAPRPTFRHRASLRDLRVQAKPSARAGAVFRDSHRGRLPGSGGTTARSGAKSSNRGEQSGV
jgi:CheY-like chemotaxis protein